jgi:hypothetical protein
LLVARNSTASVLEEAAWKPSDASIPQKPDEFIEGLPAHLFGRTTSGSETSRVAPGVNPWEKHTLSVTRQAEIMKRDPERARQLEAEARSSGAHYALRTAAGKR